MTSILDGVTDTTEATHKAIQEWYTQNDGRCYESWEEMVSSLNSKKYHLFFMDRGSSTPDDRKWTRFNKSYTNLQPIWRKIYKIHDEKRAILSPECYEEFRLEEKEYLVLYAEYEGNRRWIQISGTGLIFGNSKIEATNVRKNWTVK